MDAARRRKLGSALGLIGGLALVIDGVTKLADHRLDDPFPMILLIGGIALLIAGFVLQGLTPRA